MIDKIPFYDFKKLHNFLAQGHSGTHLIYVQGGAIVLEIDYQEEVTKKIMQEPNRVVSVAGSLQLNHINKSRSRIYG